MAFPCDDKSYARLNRSRKLSLDIGSTYCTPSVHVLSALLRPARARQLDILDRELVVVGELLSGNDLLHGKYDDVLLAPDVHNL